MAMARAGVDMDTYKELSVRSVASSDMLRCGFSLQQVLARANWSPNSHIFVVFYKQA